MSETSAAHQSAEEPEPPIDPRTFQLVQLVLAGCTVERHDGDGFNPGHVETNQTIDDSYSDGILNYLVTNRFHLVDGDDEPVATIEVSFNAAYRVGDQEPASEAIAEFSRSVIMHVTPFIREFVSTTANRLGIAPFLLPLVRRSEIELHRAEPR